MTSSDSQSCISKPNEHIEKYLDDYCNNMSKKKSNYAVLIAGDWGIGKTQFINKYIDSLHNIAYISLNGISKTSDLSRVMLNTLLQINAKFSLRMLIKMLIKLFFTVLITVLLISPIQCFIKGIFFLNPITEIIEIVVLGIGIGVWRCWDTVFAFLAEHIATNVVVYKVYSLLFPKNSFVLVFDDLERSTIPIEELLGYINYFVEQQKVKTIIIANTEQIVNRYPKNQEKDKQLGTFNIIKEKIISITFPLTADVDDIVITILNQVEAEELKKKLLDLADHIIKIFNQADYKNFRSLEHSILSFQRLYRDALKHCDNINDNKFRTILETFLILSLEHHYSDKLETKLWSNMTNDDAKNGEKSFYDKYKKYIYIHLSNYYLY